MAKPSRAKLATLDIPEDATIEGAVNYPGPMIVAGCINGDVTAAELTIAEAGVVNGSVRADAAVIAGEVNGEAFANTLTLKASAVVSGDIFHNQLVLEDGCYFEGKSRRMILPLQLAS